MGASVLISESWYHMNIWHDMKTRWDMTLASQPRWDGNRLAFTMTTEGKRIPCAISRSALQNLAGHTPLATSDLLGRFMDSRGRIEEIAARIFHITPEWVSGPVSIWADDIDNPPPARVVEVGPKVNPAGICNNGTPQVILDALVRAAVIPAFSRSASR